MLSKSPIGQFAKVGAGQGAPQRETDFSMEGIPFIRAGHLEELLNGKEENDLPKVDSEIAKEYRLKLYQPNTIVFAKSGMSALKGRIYKLKNPCFIVNHLATLELSERANPDYVLHLLRYFSPVKLISDNAYPSLNLPKIENFVVPFPEKLSDQLHIANLLSKAENLISQRKQSIALLDEFLKSTFLDMFGDPNKNSKEWRIDKLKNQFHSEPQNGLYKPSTEYGEGTRILRIDSFYNGKVYRIDKLKRLKVTKEEIEKYGLFENDIVINRVNSREYL